MEQWWNKPYIQRRDWILESLEELCLTPEEAMFLLLIDYLNEHQIPISKNVLENKLKYKIDDIKKIVNRLLEKQYLKIYYDHESKKIFSIDNLFLKKNINESVPKNVTKSTSDLFLENDETSVNFDESLFQLFEEEFARPLSSLELKRLSDWIYIYGKQFIYYALRESVIYEKVNFDYIEKILITWKQKGVTLEDILKQ